MSPITFADACYDWRSPKKEWVGGVVDYEIGQVGANPPDDFVPPLRPPEGGGFLRFEKDLVVEGKPEGQLAAVGENRIFSSRLVEAVRGKEVGHFGGDVLYMGTKLADWHRFAPLHRSEFLSPMCSLPQMSCAICGAPHYPHFGIDDSDLTKEPGTNHGTPGQIAMWILQRKHRPKNTVYVARIDVVRTSPKSVSAVSAPGRSW